MALCLISKVRKESVVPATVPDDINHLFAEKAETFDGENADGDGNRSYVNPQPQLLKLAESESRRLEEATAARLKYSRAQSKAAVTFLQAQRDFDMEHARAAHLQDSILSLHSRISDLENDLEQLGADNIGDRAEVNISWLESSIRELTAKQSSVSYSKSQVKLQIKADKEIFSQKSKDKSILQASNNRLKDKLMQLRRDHLRNVHNRAELGNAPGNHPSMHLAVTNDIRRDSKGIKLSDQAQFPPPSSVSKSAISAWETFGQNEVCNDTGPIDIPLSGLLRRSESK